MDLVGTRFGLARSVDHATNRIGSIFELVKKDRNEGVIDRLFALVRFQVAFGLIGFNLTIVNQDLVPKE